MPSTAVGKKDFVSAASISLARNAPAPAQVTATVQWRMNGRAYGLSLRTLRPIAADGAR